MTLSWPPNPEEVRLVRTQVMLKCRQDPAYAAVVYRRCKDDPIYFLETFGWVENRQGIGTAATAIPLVLYPQQKEYVLHLVGVLKEAAESETFRHNELIEKARKTAGTWSTLLVFIWFLVFHNASFLIMSKKEDDVDRDGDLDTPFEKIRFFMRRLPDFLLPAGFDINSRKWSKTLLLKLPNGGQISGDSSAASATRQKRALAILYDEFAYCENDEAIWTSGSGTAKVRIAVSTPNGVNNKYYRLRFGKEHEKIHITSFYWHLHPVFGKDKTQRSDGSWTSPWYEALKAVESAQTMAKEYDLNYYDSIGAKIFFMYGPHHVDDTLVPNPESKIIRIWDWGLCTAVLWGEIDAYDRILVYKELVIEKDSILEPVVEMALDITNTIAEGCRIEDIGDPANLYRRSAMTEDTEYSIMQRKYGIFVRTQTITAVSPQQRTKQSISFIKDKMTTPCPETRTSKFVINSKECPILHQALSGGYAWQVDHNGQIMEGKPASGHPYEDVADDLRYLALHANAGNIRGGGKPKLNIVKNGSTWTTPRDKKAVNQQNGWKSMKDNSSGRDERGGKWF